MVQIVGVVPDYTTVHPDQLDHGRFISDSDVTNKSRVAVVGSQIVTDLFGGLDPVGKSIKINGIQFKVIGVMKSQGSGGFGFGRGGFHGGSQGCGFRGFNVLPKTDGTYAKISHYAENRLSIAGSTPHDT